MSSSDIVSGLRTFLLEDAELTATLGTGYGYDVWLFVGEENSSAPPIEMQGTQKTSILLRKEGSWSTQNRYNSMHFPLLSVEIYVDPLRDGVGNVISSYQRDRFAPIENIIEKLLHRIHTESQMWGDVRTLSSTKFNDWRYFTFDTTTGVRIAACSFEVVQG
jgi:hypothetical protein